MCVYRTQGFSVPQYHFQVLHLSCIVFGRRRLAQSPMRLMPLSFYATVQINPCRFLAGGPSSLKNKKFPSENVKGTIPSRDFHANS